MFIDTNQSMYACYTVKIYKNKPVIFFKTGEGGGGTRRAGPGSATEFLFFFFGMYKNVNYITSWSCLHCYQSYNLNLIVLERIVKLLELVFNPFVFVYTIKYVQFNSNQFTWLFNSLSINIFKILKFVKINKLIW